MKILVVSNKTKENQFFQQLHGARIGDIHQLTEENFLLSSVDYRDIALVILLSTSITILELSALPFIKNLSVPLFYVLSENQILTSSDYDVITSNNHLKNIEIINASATSSEMRYRFSKTIQQFQALQFRNDVISLKDQVLAIIAHDLKNVFVGLQGLSKNLTLMTEGLDDDTVEYFSLLESGIDQGYLLLINLIEWSKLQSGQILLRFENIKLREIIDQNVSLLHLMSIKKSQEVVCDIDASIEILCDKNMVSSVIRNIMNNAMKFTPEKGKISIAAEINEEKNSVTISISDTGIGISEDQIKKLFSTDTTETTIGTSGEIGTGLGLLLCKDLIHRNGGTFWVNSTLGQGTSFFFTVPITPNS